MMSPMVKRSGQARSNLGVGLIDAFDMLGPKLIPTAIWRMKPHRIIHAKLKHQRAQSIGVAIDKRWMV